MRVIYCVILGSLLYFPQLAYSKSYDLLEVYELALNHSKNIQISSLKIQKSTAASKTSFSSLLPQINASLSESKVNSFPVVEDGEIIEERDQKRESSITISQTLYNPEDYHNYQASKKEIQLQRLLYAQEKQSLGILVLEGYFGLLLEQNHFESIKAKLASIEKLHELALKKYKNGLLSQTEILESSQEKDLTILQQKMALQKIELAKKKLYLLTGVEVNSIISLKKNQTQSLILEDLEFWKDNIESNNMDIQTKQMKQQITQSKKEAVYSQWYPSVELFYTYKETNVPALEPERIFGIQLSWNLFNGMQSYALLEEKELELRILEEEYEQTSLSVITEISNAYYIASHAKKNQTIYYEMIKTAKKIVSQLKRQEMRNKKTILDVIEAESDLTDVLYKFYKNFYEFILNKAKLNLYKGKLTLDVLEEYNELLEKKKL